MILWNKLTQLLHFLCTWEPMYQARWFSALLRQVNSRRLFCMQRKLATLQTTFSFCVIWWESTLRLAANLPPCWYKMKESHLQISIRFKHYLNFHQFVIWIQTKEKAITINSSIRVCKRLNVAERIVWETNLVVKTHKYSSMKFIAFL